VQVLVDLRGPRDRRGHQARRGSQRFIRAAADQRLITNAAGRRIADRRRAPVPAPAGMALPRSVRRAADRIVFVRAGAPADR